MKLFPSINEQITMTFEVITCLFEDILDDIQSVKLPAKTDHTAAVHKTFPNRSTCSI